MTAYNRREWASHLFDVEGSMVREILWRVIAAVVWSMVVVAAYVLGPSFFQHLSIPAIAHSLVGTSLGLLLVFRTNSSYDRFWEGRKQWGGIVNECRNLARQSRVWLASDNAVMQEVIDWTIAFPYATKQRLQTSAGLGLSSAVTSRLSRTELTQVESTQHAPLAIARILTSRILAARTRGLIDGLQLSALDHNIQLLIDYCGACERIHSTPMPFAYCVHLRRLLIVYCFTLPFALVKDFGWATIPTTLLLSYSLFGVEEIGVEIENPFEFTINDLPLEAICNGIEAVLGESEVRGLQS